jgi:hypothetical protein
MAIGDKAYRNTVPSEARQLAADKNLGKPNWFVPATDAPPYYPTSVRSIFQKMSSISAANGKRGTEQRAVD